MNKISLTARKLQSQAILSEWIRYAQEIFNEKPDQPTKTALKDDQPGNSGFSLKKHFLPRKEREENGKPLTFHDCGSRDATAAREVLSLSFCSNGLSDQQDHEHGEDARRAPARTSKRSHQVDSDQQGRLL